MVGRGILPDLLLALLISLPARAKTLPELQREDVLFPNSRSVRSLAILLGDGQPTHPCRHR